MNGTGLVVSKMSLRRVKYYVIPKWANERHPDESGGQAKLVGFHSILAFIDARSRNESVAFAKKERNNNDSAIICKPACSNSSCGQVGNTCKCPNFIFGYQTYQKCLCIY